MDDKTEQKPRQRLFDRPSQVSEPPPRRGMPTWALAAVLSLIVLAGWAIFLQVAPAPEAVAPPAPVMAAAPVPAAPTAANALRLTLWRNIIPAEIIAGFEAESGLKVEIESYDTNEQLAARIDAGTFAADVAVVSGVGVKRLMAADLLAPLPPLAGAPALDPAIIARTGIYDPGNGHAAVVQWGTMGLAFDANKVAAAVGNIAIDSWGLLFDAEAMAKLAACGVQVVDSPAGAFPIALLHLGRPADSASAEDTETASRAWEGVRSSIGKFANAGVVDALAEGKVCFALATSGDAYQSRRKAQASAAESRPDIRYVVPKEGTVVWYALAAVPKASANPTGAAKFADYLLRPDVAARLSNAQGLANAVPSSLLALKADLKDDAAFLPPPAAFAAFAPELEPSAAAAALRNRFWQLINPPAPTTP